MYNSSYNRPKFTLEAKDTQKPKGKSCGYYLRLVFFFSSLIQSLIIVSLVLFLVYGQPQKTVDEKRVEELQQGYNKLSGDNTKLRKEKADLATLLKTKTAEKDAAEKKASKLNAEVDAGKDNYNRLQHSLNQCNANKQPLGRSAPPVCPPAVSTASAAQIKSLQTLLDQQKSLYSLLQSNFSHTVQGLRVELNSAIRDKTKHEEAIQKWKQENEDLSTELKLYTKKCKEDFTSSLQGIQDVTAAFLSKIDNLFPDTFTFHLTCNKQQEQLDKIQINCTNLSRQVENKFQNYLNSVGERVSTLQARSSNLEVQNKRLNTELQKCNKSHTQDMEQCNDQLRQAQQRQDSVVEPLLKAQNQLLTEKQMLQASCASKQPPMPRPSGLDTSVLYGQHGRTGQSALGAHGVNPVGSSSSSSSSSSNTRVQQSSQQSRAGSTSLGSHGGAWGGSSSSSQLTKVR